MSPATAVVVDAKPLPVGCRGHHVDAPRIDAIAHLRGGRHRAAGDPDHETRALGLAHREMDRREVLGQRHRAIARELRALRALALGHDLAEQVPRRREVTEVLLAVGEVHRFVPTAARISETRREAQGTRPRSCP